MLPLPGARVQSLLGELRSHKPHGAERREPGLCAPGAATLGLKESQYHQGWAVNCWGTGWRVGWGWGKPRKRGRYLVREASCRREQGQEAERG